MSLTFRFRKILHFSFPFKQQQFPAEIILVYKASNPITSCDEMEILTNKETDFENSAWFHCWKGCNNVRNQYKIKITFPELKDEKKKKIKSGNWLNVIIFAEDINFILISWYPVRIWYESNLSWNDLVLNWLRQSFVALEKWGERRLECLSGCFVKAQMDVYRWRWFWRKMWSYLKIISRSVTMKVWIK